MMQQQPYHLLANPILALQPSFWRGAAQHSMMPSCCASACNPAGPAYWAGTASCCMHHHPASGLLSVQLCWSQVERHNVVLYKIAFAPHEQTLSPSHMFRPCLISSAGAGGPSCCLHQPALRRAALSLHLCGAKDAAAGAYGARWRAVHFFPVLRVQAAAVNIVAGTVVTACIAAAAPLLVCYRTMHFKRWLCCGWHMPAWFPLSAAASASGRVCFTPWPACALAFRHRGSISCCSTVERFNIQQLCLTCLIIFGVCASRHMV